MEPDVFQAYLNCVYVGPETLEEIPGAFEREVRGATVGFSDLYVYNVCKDVTREDLILRFEESGNIKSVFISKHSSAHSRFESSRIAKIVFFTVEAGLAAIKTFDGFVLHGHRLTVKASHRGLTVTDLEECNKRRYELADLLYNKLIKLYLLADQLQDTTTSNMVMDKIEQFYATERVHPGTSQYRLLTSSLWREARCEKCCETCGFTIRTLIPRNSSKRMSFQANSSTTS